MAASTTEPYPLEKRRYHRVMVKDQEFDVDERYTKLKYIGGGAYGFVAAAYDTKKKTKVAIKKIKDTFRELLDAKRILRELRLLQHFNHHENLLYILDIMVSPQRSNFKDVYIVTDLMETDLSRIIESSQTLSDSHIKYFVYQILRAMKYIHSANVLHRDLKPQNILVNANCELVVCDFGLARPMGEGEDDASAADLTQYVVTRWYRAPELLTGADSYDAAIDVWSIGCILAEILGRRPLFPGRNYLHQLQVIIDILGTPSDADCWFIRKRPALKAVQAMGQRAPVSFHKLFPHANPQAIDLLQKMLAFDPAKRITVTDALAHPYLADYHFPDDEPECPTRVSFAFEGTGAMTKPELQGFMLSEAAHFNPSRVRPVSTRMAGLASATTQDVGGMSAEPAAPAEAAVASDAAAKAPPGMSAGPKSVPPPPKDGIGQSAAAAAGSAGPLAGALEGMKSQLLSAMAEQFKTVNARLAGLEARLDKLESKK